MTEQRRLIIITGPPGAGKTTYADTLPYETYDQNNGNKAMWRDSTTSCALVTAAPGADAKEYWCKEARRFGFLPQLLVVDPGRAIAAQRLLRRDLENSSERRRARLSKTVQRWYANYTRHPDEDRVDG
jgi:thymidylate kinase